MRNYGPGARKSIKGAATSISSTIPPKNAACFPTCFIAANAAKDCTSRPITSRGRACYHYKHRPRQCGQDLPAKCKVSHQLEALDTKVTAAVKVIGSSPEAARQFIYFRNDGKERKKLQARLAGLEKARQSLAAKQKKLLALYLDGDWDKSFLDEQKKSLEAQIRLNEKQRQEIREQLTFLSGEQADPRLHRGILRRPQQLRHRNDPGAAVNPGAGHVHQG